MKTANEMFEELGYTKKKEDEYKIRFSDEDEFECIDFYKNNHSVAVSDCGDATSIKSKEHLAIHQQMKELGWIE